MLLICPAIFQACLFRADSWPACFSVASGVRNLSRAGKLLDPSTLATIHASAFLMATRVIESRSGNAESSALRSGVGDAAKCSHAHSYLQPLFPTRLAVYTLQRGQLLSRAAAPPQTHKMTAILTSSA
jgi:hypothetical protein